jgi:hypothetical protein
MGNVSEKDSGSFFNGLAHHLSASREARQGLASAKDLPSFFDGLGYYVRVSREARQSLASAVAESFSVFDYIEPHENRLSTIIADLLDPKGKHGQGSTFLAAFLKQLVEARCRLASDWETRLDEATVVNEGATSFLSSAARRIDIRIELPQRFGIGIENKPWAGEQEAQLADYSKDLERRYQGGFVLVFLCQRGRKPESISEAEWSELRRLGKCATLHYTGEFLNWLSECFMRAEADKVRHFIKDFRRYIESNLSGVEPTEEEEENVQS